MPTLEKTQPMSEITSRISSPSARLHEKNSPQDVVSGYRRSDIMEAIQLLIDRRRFPLNRAKEDLLAKLAEIMDGFAKSFS